MVNGLTWLKRGGSFPAVILLLVFLAGCGGNNDTSIPVPSNLTGTVRVSLSDPPTCEAPAGNFTNVWVTVTRVRVHVSNTAAAADSGWVDLTDLTDNPLQIDLLGTPDTSCVLATLGSTVGLPAGNYQQIRIHLLSNSPAQGVATPATNNCGTEGFNCAMFTDGSVTRIDLSSQDQTGIKIPKGRIAGGGLSLEAEQSSDINIDFNACASFVMGGGPGPQQGPGGIRFKPTLRAGEVSFTNSLQGRVVDSSTSAPLADATIFVYAEQPDDEEIDRVIMQTRADATLGTFLFCPLPEGNYDIVVTAMDGAGVTHHPTVTFDVPLGTNLGDIPVVGQTAPDTGPGQFEGLVTAASSGGGAAINATMAALQAGTPEGGTERLVTIPPLGDSTGVVETAAGGTCPAGTNCATYVLIVPAGNASFGTFDSGGTTYAGPVAGSALYLINALASLLGTEEPTCSPSSITVDSDDAGAALAALAGVTTVPAQIDFTGCN